jgi:4-hydroxy-tetrahydrodipicolinate reductase
MSLQSIQSVQSVQSEQYGQYIVSDAKDFLNMRCGQPAPYYLKMFSDIYNQYKKTDMSTELFQYGKKDGFDSFKTGVKKMIEQCSFVKEDDLIDPEHIYMTNGVTHAVQLLTSYFKSGYLTGKTISTIYIEELTYFLIKTHLENIGIQIKTFSFDNLDKLEKEVLNNELNNQFNKIDFAFYIIPFCHNPTGKTVSTQNLERFLSIAKDHVILSDETYLFLHSRTENNLPYNKERTLYFYPNKNIISMHTFSKIMAPGLRLGFILTKNTNIIQKLNDSGFLDSGGSVNPIIAYNVSHILNNHLETYKIYLQTISIDLRRKINFICKEFDKYPEHFSYDNPDGGYFIFFQTKKVSGAKFEELCEKAKISFHNSNKFGKNPTFNDKYYRLSVSYYNIYDIQTYFSEKLKILVELINENSHRINIWCLGYKGRLGSLIMEELAKSNNNYLYRGLDRGYDIRMINSNDIIIDVSSPQGLEELLTELLKKPFFNYPKIITGTTGIAGTSVEKLIELYGEKSTVIVKSNFSRGIQSILNCIKSFDTNYWEINIEDIHHTKKKDSPSGTALTLQKELQKITPCNINIDSTRVGDVIGLHTISFKTPNETISIIHEVKDRRVFAVGCTQLIKNIQNLNNGVYYNNV